MSIVHGIRLIKCIYPALLAILLYFLNYISMKAIIAGYFLFCVYQNITSNTALFYNPTEINDNIINTCPSIKLKNFKPYFFLPTELLQLLTQLFIRGPKEEDIFIDREDVNHGGVFLDWVTMKNLPTNPNGPVLLILPGITGTKSDAYVMNLCRDGIKNGYRVVVYQYRVISPEMVYPTDGYIQLIEDLDCAVDKILSKDQCKIYAIGCSYGANKIVNYLGNKNYKIKKICGAVSISNPFDLLVSSRFLYNTFHDSILLYICQKALEKLLPVFEKDNKFNVDIHKAQTCVSLRDFDDAIIRRLTGFKSVDAYYRGISCVNYIQNVNVPLLCINAKDDHLTTSKGIPFDDISLNSNIILIVTDKGSHVCFTNNDSFLSPTQWFNAPAIQFINAIRCLEKDC
jgi:predicted alpha/beta-fold hydrolase